MSQVLEKPILLDETGQAIAGKLDTNSAAIVDALDDIKDAIGTSSEFIPVMIKVVTPPTKTSYRTGEALNLSGMVVNLIGSNGVQIDVTSACTCVPANGTPLTSADTSVAISYYYAAGDLTFTTSQEVGVRELTSIAISTPPTKTEYSVGETLDLTGLVVTATYDNGQIADVTSRCAFSPANGASLTTSNTSVTVTYTEGTITKTATQNITVRELTSIAITTPPTQTEYMAGEQLDLTGIVVTATYDDSTTKDVTADCVYSPADGTVLTVSDSAVSISYTEVEITKTASQSITVAQIYGAEWDGTATTAWTRTDMASNFSDPDPYYLNRTGDSSSPFDTIQPWAGMQIVNDADLGKMVSIPKFYYKLSKSGSAIKVQISSNAVEGFVTSPAHMDRGDGQGERDVVYVARYHSSNSDKKSTSGTIPQSRNNAASQLVSDWQYSDIGSKCWISDFAMFFTIWLLYIVEYADWDCQEKIGRGGSPSSQSTPFATGYTDSMPYHTGSTNYRNTQGGTQYRNIEGLWDNVYDLIYGCRYDTSSNLYVIIKPSDFSITSGGVNTGVVIGGGIPKAFNISDVEGVFPFLIPSELGGGDTTYACDQWSDYSNSATCLITGGTIGNSRNYGIRCINTSKVSGSGGVKCGFRIMKLPNNS